jgi:hypothetical protein
MDRCCSEPVKTIPEVTRKAVCWTEPLRSARSLASAKYPKPSFQMLIVPLDSLLLGFSGDMLGLREYDGQSRCVSSRFVVVTACGVTLVF